MAPHCERASNRCGLILAALLASTALLGCSSDPGGLSDPVPRDPACEGSAADAVADGGSWRWCDGSGTYGLCAEDYPSGQRVAVCDDLTCTTYIASARGWVEEWSGEIVADCLEPEPGETVVVF